MATIFNRYISYIKKLLDRATLLERVVISFFALCMIVGTLGGVWFISDRYAVQTPTYGGRITEGVIGTPRFINPVLASSDVDRDLTSLIYSGLLRRAPDGVSFINDLAESYTVSDDGTIYTFTIRDNALFHDGKPVTSDDIAFTVEKIKDGTLKSPWRIQWIDVSVETPDEKTVSFTLQKSYAGFPLATTVGILPKHVWGNLTLEEFQFSKYNTRPVGSGPYKIARIRGQKTSPTSYTVTRFKRFVLTQPYIHAITFKFYPNETSLLKGFERKEFSNMNSFPASYASTISRRNVVVEHEELPRVFAIFMNSAENPILQDTSILQALRTALSQDELIQEILYGYGSPATGPFPSLFKGDNAASPEVSSDGAAAQAILERSGWVLNRETGIREKRFQSGLRQLSFTLSTSDTPELEAASEFIKAKAREIGINIDIKLFGIGSLDHDVIRPRKYEALLFGQALRYDTDLYAFWHSSQRKDPGFNVALYASASVDSDLEKSLKTIDNQSRIALYENIERRITNDAPVLFLYSPHMLFTFRDDIKGNEHIFVTTPSDRFTHVYEWYVRTDKVWPFFLGKTTFREIIGSIKTL